MFDVTAVASARKGQQALRRVTAWAKACSGWEKLDDARLSIRAVNCTDPDCVPVETVLFLTATGWNVSTKVLKDPVEVSKPDIEASMGELCRSGRARAVAHRARAGMSVSGAAETDVSKQADLNFSEK